jgi:hypothetical protein
MDEAAKYLKICLGWNTLVDATDYEWLKMVPWGIGWSMARGKKMRPYAVHDRLGKRYYMHRVLTTAPKGMVVDHINGDPLDNRRGNLRVVGQGQNIRNQKARSSCGYKGVYHLRGRWTSHVKRGDHTIYVGTFDTLEDAARAYDAAVLSIDGEHLHPNFPIENVDGTRPRTARDAV